MADGKFAKRRPSTGDRIDFTLCLQPLAVSRSSGLFSESETLNHVSVTLDILPLQIIEKPPPLPDEFQKSPAGVVILLVLFEVVRQIGYAGTEERDLDFRRSRVSGMQLEIVDDSFSFFDIQHCDFSSLRSISLDCECSPAHWFRPGGSRVSSCR
jgi:hypothetical protein